MSVRTRFQSVGMIPKVVGGAVLACGLVLGGVGVANAATADSASTAATQPNQGHYVTGPELAPGDEGKYTTIPQGEKRPAADTQAALPGSTEPGSYTAQTSKLGAENPDGVPASAAHVDGGALSGGNPITPTGN
jgi:hypothetical protein